LIELTVKTGKRNELLDVTSQVQEAVSKAGLKEGLCIVYCPHTTAGVAINENADPSVKEDVLRKLTELVPKDDNYSHMEGNSDGHIKAILVGNSKTIFVKSGKLVLGTWEGIFFCEFDGPRSRNLLLKMAEC